MVFFTNTKHQVEGSSGSQHDELMTVGSWEGVLGKALCVGLVPCTFPISISFYPQRWDSRLREIFFSTICINIMFLEHDGAFPDKYIPPEK